MRCVVVCIYLGCAVVFAIQVSIARSLAGWMDGWGLFQRAFWILQRVHVAVKHPCAAHTQILVHMLILNDHVDADSERASTQIESTADHSHETSSGCPSLRTRCANTTAASDSY